MTQLCNKGDLRLYCRYFPFLEKPLVGLYKHFSGHTNLLQNKLLIYWLAFVHLTPTRTSCLKQGFYHFPLVPVLMADIGIRCQSMGIFCPRSCRLSAHHLGNQRYRHVQSQQLQRSLSSCPLFAQLTLIGTQSLKAFLCHVPTLPVSVRAREVAEHQVGVPEHVSLILNSVPGTHLKSCMLYPASTVLASLQ